MCDLCVICVAIQAAPELFEAIAGESIGRLDEFEPSGIATLLWAFSKAGHVSPVLFEAAAPRVLARIDDHSAQALSDVLWVRFPQHRHYHRVANTIPTSRTPHPTVVYHLSLSLSTRHPPTSTHTKQS